MLLIYKKRVFKTLKNTIFQVPYIYKNNVKIKK